MTNKNFYGQRNEEIRDLFIINELSNLKQGGRILDAGSGIQPYRKYCSHLEYVSQDFAKYNGKGNGEGLQTNVFDYGEIDIVCDITSIPEEDNSFDFILCSEVLEHIPYPEKAIVEFSRLLKKEGFLILTAPFCSLTHFAPYHYHTGFNYYWYDKILNDNGFKIEKKEVNGNYFEYIAQELFRIPSVVQRYTGEKVDSSTLDLLNSLLVFLHGIDTKNVYNKSYELLNFGFHILAKKT